MILRPNYIAAIKPFIGKPQIKIITGIRRSGKSTVLQLIKEELLQSGIQEEQIVSINFESFSYADIVEARKLHQFVSEKIIELTGPSVNQILTYTDAIDAFKKGDYRTGAEKIAPAFARNWMFMYRQKEEGAKNSRGVQLLSDANLRHALLLHNL